jgi:hypothetical protein
MNALVFPLLASVLEGQALYDKLYTGGYHSNTTYSHSRILLRAIQRNSDIHTVFDFGCSHGFAVEQLWKSGRLASGFDVSQKAVELAAATRTHGQACLPGTPCFFSDPALLDTIGPVDAVLSSDVLEHLEPREVAMQVRRLAKMARNKLFLKIATTQEFNKQPLSILPVTDRPAALHTTIRPLTWWLQQFAVHGFQLVRKLGLDSVELGR